MKVKGQVKFVAKDKNLFFSTLKKRVDVYFKEQNLSKYANSAMVTKSATLLAMYILPFAVIVAFQPSFGISLILWSVMGFGLAGLGMSVMHDANHGAYSSNKAVNYMMAHVLNLLGASTFNWKLQHNILHHTYTNVHEMDDDINAKGLFRFTPHSPVKKGHQYQWIYSFLVYGLTTLYWVTAKDFLQFRLYTRNGVNPNTAAQNKVALAKIIAVKVIYFFVLLVVPTLFFGIPFVQVLSGFLLMQFISGVVLTLIFQLAHSVEDTTHPLPNDKGVIENDWAIHQLNTTVNFSPGNRLLSWYVGGLNFQVEHHLFPRISHVHYPKIAPIVKETAQEFGIPYLVNPTFGMALRSHITHLKTLGRLPNLNEAIG
jgi:linoleoyl-CoA desaturase